LRILYVACTRARDLLVLSAGLTERFPEGAATDRPLPVKAPNSWMLALGERFHLGNGSCLDGSIVAHRRPAVSVRVVEPVAGLPKNLSRREDGPPPDLGRWDIAPIAPKPWPAVVSVAELGGNDTATAEFRDALRGWDLMTPPPAGTLLARFAATGWPARLRRAERLLRDVDFVSPWPGPDPAARPALCGTIDFVWKETDGWHALVLDRGEGPAIRSLEAWVLREQFGAELRSVTILDLRTGTPTAFPSGPIDSDQISRKLESLLGRRYPADR
jgi:hypothetical protein